jgi:PAS domain S-box-containing protein
MQLNYKAIFDVSPSAKLILAPDAPFFTILDANQAYLDATHTIKEEIIGKGLFVVFPPNPFDSYSGERSLASLEAAIATRKTHLLPDYRYDIPIPGTDKYEECYWTTTNTPVLDQNGDILYLVHSPANITRETRVRHDLILAEERARLAIESNELGTFDLNLVTNEVITSPRFAEIFGMHTDMARHQYVDAIHPEDMASRDQAYKDALRTGKLQYQARITRPDKVQRRIKVEGRVLFDEDKKAIRVIGMLKDNTREHEAREQESKLVALVDNSVDLMSILQMDGTNAYINQAGMDLLGFDNIEQVKATPISDLHSPEDFAQVENEVLPSVMKEGRWAGNMLVRHLKTGEIFPVQNNCIRIDDPLSGEPIAVGAVMRDLRPEINAKLALAKSEYLLKTITTAAPTALWKSGPEGEIEYVNQTWLDWTGSSFEESKSGWLNFIEEEDREVTIDAFTRSIASRTDYNAEFRIRHADGTLHWCVANGKPQYNEHGVFMGFVGACIDITEQKKLQQLKDDFFAIASHELKTPVTSIKAFNQVIEKMLQSKNLEAEAAFAKKVDNQLNKLIGLISDLLDTTKINTGKLQFNNSVFSIDILLSEVINDLQYTITSHQLVTDLQGEGKVYADKERIEQVLSNIIINAVKYSPQSNEVHIESVVEGDHFYIHVKDSGIGIPEESIDKVFDQFYRVTHAHQHTIPGLGLGLYISSEIIRRQNGKISARNNDGQGTVFSIMLPLYT